MSKLLPQKAREMINNPPHGKKLTKKQNAYFHLVAEGRNKYEEGGWLEKYVSQTPGEGMPMDREQALTALNTMGEFMSIPQKGLTYLASGKYQTPSEALDIQNRWKALGIDIVLDPVNLIGAGALGKAAGKAGSLALRQALKKGVMPYGYNLETIKNIPENIRRVNKGLPKKFTSDIEQLMETHEGIKNLYARHYPRREEAWSTYLGLQKGGEHLIPMGVDKKTGYDLYQLASPSLPTHEARNLVWQLRQDLKKLSTEPTHGSDTQFGVMGRYSRMMSPDAKSIMYRDVWDLQPFLDKKVPFKNFEMSSVVPGAKPFVLEGKLADVKTKYPPAYYTTMEKEIRHKMDPYLNMDNPNYNEIRKHVISNMLQDKKAGKSNIGYKSFKEPFLYPDVSPYFKIKPSQFGESYENGGEVNYNTPSVSLPKDYVGIGYDTTGRHYSPAWGGAFANGGNIPGTVGFTYARTGSTPSNGKYAKKTMASAEDGKTITDRSKDFLLNWYEQRQIPGVDNQAIINSITNLPRERQVYMIDNNPNIQAQYTGREFLYKPNASDYVKTHERTHYIDEKFPSIMDINAKAIQGNIKPLDQLQGISNRKYDYLSSPEEMHSRIMTLRQKAGFKPNQTVTEDDLNNFLNRYKGDEQNIEDIFDVAKDKGSVVNMLNLMALNKNETNTPLMARYGGELTKLDQLENWTNYNKPTKGGWMNKYNGI